MKNRLSALLLACGLSVSMLSGAAYAADASTAATEAVSTEAQTTEAEEGESRQQTEAATPQPSKVTGEGKYASIYPALEASIEQTLSQLSSFSDEQVAQYLEAQDEQTVHLMAAWDQVRNQCGAFVNIESYEVEEDGSNIIFTDLAHYEKADEDKSKVTVTVTVDMKAQSMSYAWDVKETVGKAVKSAAENTAVGLINVFFVLFILTFIISLFRFIPNGQKKKKAEAVPQSASAPEPAPASEETEEVSDQEEIAAVIAAAAAAYESENGAAPADGFVVRSIRRRGRRSNWQNA